LAFFLQYFAQLIFLSCNDSQLTIAIAEPCGEMENGKFMVCVVYTLFRSVLSSWGNRTNKVMKVYLKLPFKANSSNS